MSDTIRLTNTSGILIGSNGKSYSIELPEGLLSENSSLLLYQDSLPSSFELQFNEEDGTVYIESSVMENYYISEKDASNITSIIFGGGDAVTFLSGNVVYQNGLTLISLSVGVTLDITIAKEPIEQAIASQASAAAVALMCGWAGAKVGAEFGALVPIVGPELGIIIGGIVGIVGGLYYGPKANDKIDQLAQKGFFKDLGEFLCDYYFPNLEDKHEKSLALSKSLFVNHMLANGFTANEIKIIYSQLFGVNTENMPELPGLGNDIRPKF